MAATPLELNRHGFAVGRYQRRVLRDP